METKRSYLNLSADVAAASNQIEVGGAYRHYKNQHLYTVLGFAILEATNQVAVLYQPQAEGSDLTFVRPVNEWLENVEWEGSMVQRFTKV